MHFFEQFKYCPCCGHHYAPENFDSYEVVFRCPDCHYEFYQNGTPAATALIPQADNPEYILLITRNTQPGKGLLDLPGGILRYGELPEEAVIREIYEETRLNITPLSMLQTTAIDYYYQGSQIFIVESCFLTAPVTNDISHIQTTEASSMSYYPATSLIRQAQQLAFPEHRTILQKYLEDLSVKHI